LLEIIRDENGEIESTKVNFPQLNKSVSAPGNAVVKALDAIGMWA